MSAKGKERLVEPAVSETNEDGDSNLPARLRARLRSGQLSTHRITAWCQQTGLIAYPAPHTRYRASAVASTSVNPITQEQEQRAPSTPCVCLAIPPISSAVEDQLPQASFQLQLPEAPSAPLRGPGHEYISYLSFSPDGSQLVAFTTFESDSRFPRSTSIRLVLFIRGDELNTWMCTFDWDSRRAKGNLVQPGLQPSTDLKLDGEKVLDVQWLERSPIISNEGPAVGEKRRNDALLQFSGISALVAVLDSNEMLVAHLPYQALQPQIFIASLEFGRTTSQDLSNFGTSFSAIPTMQATSIPAMGMNSLGMGITGTTPVDPLQKAMNNPTPGQSLQAVLQTVKDPAILAQYNVPSLGGGLVNPVPASSTNLRLAAVGSPSTVQREGSVPDAPPPIVSQFMLAVQARFQPHLLKAGSREGMKGTVVEADNPAAGSGLGTLASGLNVGNSIAIDVNTTESNPQGTAKSFNSTTLPAQNSTTGNPTFSEFASFGQSSNNFDGGYGDVNMSALDELFDSDFAGIEGTHGGNFGGLSSSLDSFNHDFAASFPSATEPDGAPSPMKKDQFGNPSIETGTNRSESPSKSVLDGTNDNSASRGSSPRKSFGQHTGEEHRLLPEKLDDQVDLAGQWEALSALELLQITIDWTEYGVLAVTMKHVANLDSQTAALIQEKATGPEVINHICFYSNRNDVNASEILLTVSDSIVADENVESVRSKCRSYTVQEIPFVLCDAFSTLEGRKSDPNPTHLEGRKQWIVSCAPSTEDAVSGIVLDIFKAPTRLGALLLDSSGIMRTGAITSSRGGVPAAPLIDLALPVHWPCSMAISPTGSVALLCALSELDNAQVLGKPALLSLSPAHRGLYSECEDHATVTKDEDVRRKVDEDQLAAWASATLNSIIARRSARDILISVARLSEASKLSFLREIWKSASGIVVNARVEQTRLLWPLLSVQRQLIHGIPGQLLDDITQLSACQRMLQDSKTTFRSAPQQNNMQPQVAEGFEGDAIWPIIGRISWIFKLWDRIIVQMTSSALNEDWSTVSFIIVHPLSRGIQQRLVRLIARFANFMMNLRDDAILQSNRMQYDDAVLDTEVAKNILGDLIVSNRTKTQEWSGMLHGLATKLGSEWTDDSPKAREALVTMRLPNDVEKTVREIAIGIREKLLPLVTSPHVRDSTLSGSVSRSGIKGGLRVPNRDSSVQIDAVTATPIHKSGGRTKICISCTGLSQLVPSLNASEWENSKGRTCICGGQWLAL